MPLKITLVSPHLAQIESILATIASLDQKLIAGVEEESSALKDELLKLCSARGVTNRYRDYDGRFSRFVDVEG